jgi:hypothetical protein
MNSFYLYFFIRQILQTLVFLSDIDKISKIFSIMLIDFTGKFKPFYHSDNLNDSNDRVVLMDTIGSVFAYFQILIIIIENKLFTKNQFIIILSVLLLHVCSVLNYLYDIPNGVKSEKNGLFPDLFKPILLIFLLYNNSISSTGTGSL